MVVEAWRLGGSAETRAQQGAGVEARSERREAISRRRRRELQCREHRKPIQVLSATRSALRYKSIAIMTHQRAIILSLTLNLIGTSFLILRVGRSLPDRQAAATSLEFERETLPLYTYQAVLVRVIDGDTVVLDVDFGFDTWIRIHGVDVPEVVGESKIDGLRGN